MPDPRLEIEEHLYELGRTMVIEEPSDELALAVLTRIATDAPRPGRARPHARRRRLVAVVVAALLVALTLTPPVRAAVLHWLRIGGVVIRTAPAPSTGLPPPATTSGPSTPVPSAPRSVGGLTVRLDQVRTMVAFPVVVPAELGDPDQVTVSSDRRVVGMDWGRGADARHLDQFDGQLSWVFVKQFWGDVTIVSVDGREAVWLNRPHTISYVDRDGTEHSAQARTAGKTLVWERGSAAGPRTTLRLEADLDQRQAITIAESVR